jgi:hypothetical protein
MSSTLTGVPAPPFGHLLRMTDDTGLFEHASGCQPALEHGYCVDDVARGLAIVCREPDPAPELTRAARVYLRFLAQAQAQDGRFTNRLGHDGRWHGDQTTEDHWGRALWGLGTAAARGPGGALREEARERFERGARLPTPFPHSITFAALGAAEVLAGWPGHPGALTVLGRVREVIGEPPDDPGWPWPGQRLSYASAAIAEAVIAAGAGLGDDRLLDGGLRMLDWLLSLCTRGGHLSVVPVGGWDAADMSPGFDQQPIEVAAIADACARAAAVTGDRRWLAGTGSCVAWYLGANDAGTVMLNEQTGGGYDGLKPDRPNPNQGAESTLAMICVLQHARSLARLAPEHLPAR